MEIIMKRIYKNFLSVVRGHAIRAIAMAGTLAIAIHGMGYAQYSPEAIKQKKASDLYDEWGFLQGKSLMVDGNLAVSSSTGQVAYTYPISSANIKGHPLTVSLNYASSVAFTAYKDYKYSNYNSMHEGWNKFSQNRPAWILGVNEFAIQVVARSWDFVGDRTVLDNICPKTTDNDLVWTVDGFDVCNRMADFKTNTQEDIVDVIKLLRSDGSVLELRNAHPYKLPWPADPHSHAAFYTGHYVVASPNARGFAVVEFDTQNWPNYVKQANYRNGYPEQYAFMPRKVRYYSGDGLEYVFSEWLVPYGKRPYTDHRSIPKRPTDRQEKKVFGASVAGPTVFYLERINSSEGLVAEFGRTRHKTDNSSNREDWTRGRALITSFAGHRISWGDGYANIEVPGRTVGIKFDKSIWSGKHSDAVCPMGSFESSVVGLEERELWSRDNITKSVVGYVTEIRDVVTTRFAYEPYSVEYAGFLFPNEYCNTDDRGSMALQNLRLHQVIEPTEIYKLCYYRGNPRVMGAAASVCPTGILAGTFMGTVRPTNSALETMYNYPFWRNNVMYRVEKYANTPTAPLLRTDIYSDFAFPYVPAFSDVGAIATSSKVTTHDHIAGTSTSREFEYNFRHIPRDSWELRAFHPIFFTELKKETTKAGTTMTTMETTYESLSGAKYLFRPVRQTLAVQERNADPVTKSLKIFSYTTATVRDYGGKVEEAQHFGKEVLGEIARTFHPIAAPPNDLLAVDTVVYEHLPLVKIPLRRDTLWDENASRDAYRAEGTLQPFEEVAFTPGISRSKIEVHQNVPIPPIFGLVKKTGSVSIDRSSGTPSVNYEGGTMNVYESDAADMTTLAPRGSILQQYVKKRGNPFAPPVPANTYNYTRWWSKSLPSAVTNAQGSRSEMFYDFRLPSLRRNDGTYRTPVGYMVRNNDQNKAYEFTNGEYFTYLYEQPMVTQSLVRKYDPTGQLFVDTLASFTKPGFHGLPAYKMGPNGWVNGYSRDGIGRLKTGWLPYDFPRPASVAGQAFVGEKEIQMHKVVRRTTQADVLQCYGDGTSEIISGTPTTEITGGTFYAFKPKIMLPACPCDDPESGCEKPFLRDLGHTGHLEYQIHENDPLDAAIDISDAYLRLYVSSYSGPPCLTFVVESPELGLSVPYVLGCSDKDPGRNDQIGGRVVGNNENPATGKEKDDSPGRTLLAADDDDDGKPDGFYIKVSLKSVKQQLLALNAGSTVNFTVSMKTTGGYVNFASTAVDSRPRLVLKGTFMTEDEEVRERDDYSIAFNHDDQAVTSEVLSKVDDKFHSANISPDESGLGIRRTAMKRTFGPDNRVTSIEIPMKDRNQPARIDRITAEYNGLGQAIKSTDQAGLVSETKYDPMGRTTQGKNPDNTFATVEYMTGTQDLFGIPGNQDFLGFCTRTITTNENGVKTARFTDAFDRLRQEVIDYGDGKQNITTKYEYNPSGQLNYIVTPSGARIEYVYHEDFGQVRYKKQGDQGMISYAYDDLGNMRFAQTQDQFASGNMSFNQYDDLGRLTVMGEAVLPTAGETRLTDILNPNYLHDDAVSGIATANSTLWQTPQTEVPQIFPLDQLTTETNCGMVWGLEELYEGIADGGYPPMLRHPVRMHEPIETPAAYNDFEHLARHPHFIRTVVQYDTLPYQAGPAWNGFPSWDKWNALVPGGKVRNQKGRQAAVAYRGHGGEPFQYMVMSYDERGNIEALLRYTENLGFDAVYYESNSMNEIVSVRVADPIRQHTTWYGYDDNGRIDSVWTQLGVIGSGISPMVDPITREIQTQTVRHPAPIERPANADVAYSYTKHGAINTKYYPQASARMDYTYHSTRLWLTGISAKQELPFLPDANELQMTWSHDDAGIIRAQTYKPQQQPEKKETYVYDNAGRLTSWKAGSVITSYNYDVMGNRLREQITNPFTINSYTYGTAGGVNRLGRTRTERDGVERGSTQYSYNDDGAVTGMSTRGENQQLVETKQLQYNAFNQLYSYKRQQENGGGGFAEYRYRYSPAGEREQKRLYSTNAPDDEERYMWCYYLLGADQRQLAVYNGQQTSSEDCGTGITGERRVYLYPDEYRTYGTAGDVEIVTDKYGMKQYLLSDHLGSTRMVITSLGLYAEPYDYKAFGEEIGINSNRRRNEYIGNEKDPESLLSDFGLRKYDDQTGRFLSIDPMWESFPGQSPYSYSFNSPIVLKDPNGDAPIIAWMLINGGISAGAEIAKQVLIDGKSASEIDMGDVGLAFLEGAVTSRTKVVGTVVVSSVKRFANEIIDGKGVGAAVEAAVNPTDIALDLLGEGTAKLLGNTAIDGLEDVAKQFKKQEEIATATIQNSTLLSSRQLKKYNERAAQARRSQSQTNSASLVVKSAHGLVNEKAKLLNEYIVTTTFGHNYDAATSRARSNSSPSIMDVAYQNGMAPKKDGTIVNQ